jgi:hypothetical protein
VSKNYPKLISQKLENSYYRTSFHLKKKETEYLKKKGLATIREEALDFIIKRIAPARPKNDGRQTPMRNHPVFIAQHATATCCRKCIEKWHNIPRGREMKKEEIEKLVDVIMYWIDLESTRNVRHQFLK